MSPAEVVALVLELARALGVPAVRALEAACELRPELREVEIPDVAADIDRALEDARKRTSGGAP